MRECAVWGFLLVFLYSGIAYIDISSFIFELQYIAKTLNLFIRLVRQILGQFLALCKLRWRPIETVSPFILPEIIHKQAAEKEDAQCKAGDSFYESGLFC